MAIYSAGFRGTSITSSGSQPLFDIRSSATDSPRILEISGWLENPSSGSFVLGVGRPATSGVVKINPVVLQPNDPNYPSTSVSIGYEWSTVPTSPTSFMRRLAVGNIATPTTFRFAFPSGITLSGSSSLVVWIISTTASALAPMNANISVDLDT